MKTRTPSKSRLIVLVLALLIITPSLVSAQQPGPVAQWIDDTNIHRIMGYVTLTAATVTAGLGLFGVEVHPYVGLATAGLSATSTALGVIAYRDRMSYAWPHAALNGLATTGFLLNAFALEGGSRAHVAAGIGSLVSMYGAYGAIILLIR